MFLTTDANLSGDTNYVFAVAEEQDTVGLFDYVLIEAADKQWMGQIVELSPHIGKSGNPTDQHIIKGCSYIAQGISARMSEYNKFWKIRLLCEIENGDTSTLRNRPEPGAKAGRMEREMTMNVLGLPRLKIDNSKSNVIGYLINAHDVPLCIQSYVFTHHIMVNGGSGCGKSNTCANLIDQADRLGFTVFVHDAKPDYRMIKDANTDPGVMQSWLEFTEKYLLAPHGAQKLTNVAIYGIGAAKETSDYSKYDFVFGLNASDLSAEELASLFFDGPTDDLAYEGTAKAHEQLSLDRNGHGFKMTDVAEWVTRNTQDDKKNPSGAIHPKTSQKMLRRFSNSIRRFPWLDAVGKSIRSQSDNNAFSSRGRTVEKLDVVNLVGRKGIIHIDYAMADETSYAVIMAKFMQYCQGHQSSDDASPGGIVQFVDEAHRIFNNDSKFSRDLGHRFGRVMVEGRSKKHGIIISLQNSIEVPARLLNNVNTHIVMRQNSREVAAKATETMGREFAEQALTLGKGAALCRIIDSPYTVLAKMAPSPFDLERSRQD